MDRRLRELGISGLAIIDKIAHSAIRGQSDDAEFVSLQGVDLSRRCLSYNQEGVRVGTAFLRDRLREKVDQFSAGVVGPVRSRSEILLIERGDPDPFYCSETSEGQVGRQSAARDCQLHRAPGGPIAAIP